MSLSQEAYDAELTATAYGLLLLVQRQGEGPDFTLFTDSQAAMKIADDALGPGQEIAMEVIRLSRRLV